MTIDDCLARLGSTLPASTATADRKAKRAALRLNRLFTRLESRLTRAQASSGSKQTRYYRKGSRTLGVLVVTAQSAERKGALGVPLGPVQSAAAALLAKFQS